jgi:type VI protein secretion system component VasK
MKAFFTWRVLLAVLGLLMVALLIWFLGPYIGFVFSATEFRPLESVTARVVAILLVVAAWLLFQMCSACARRAPATT